MKKIAGYAVTLSSWPKTPIIYMDAAVTPSHSGDLCVYEGLYCQTLIACYAAGSWDKVEPIFEGVPL